jgi:hypothetical protein
VCLSVLLLTIFRFDENLQGLHVFLKKIKLSEDEEYDLGIFTRKQKKPPMLKITQSQFTDAWVDISVADPDPGSGAFLTLGSGSRMG